MINFDGISITDDPSPNDGQQSKSFAPGAESGALEIESAIRRIDNHISN